MEQMNKGLIVKQIRSTDDIKRKMFTTMNKDYEGSFTEGSNTLDLLLLAKHSPINIAMFEVSGWVADRTHSHLRTHSGIQHVYWCGSSRTEISYGEEFVDEDGTMWRYINFDLSLDALIHISERRLCPTAHENPRADWNTVVDQCNVFIPELEKFCVKPCVWYAMCTEPRKNCGFMATHKYRKQRLALVAVSYTEIIKQK